MPKVDGSQVLAKMNAEPDLRRIPVIVMSSSGAEKDLVRGTVRRSPPIWSSLPTLRITSIAIRTVKERLFQVVALTPNGRSAARQNRWH
jgi:two-component system response regulator